MDENENYYKGDILISNDSRILVTGCGGMLGEAIYSLFSSKCIMRATDIDLNEELRDQVRKIAIDNNYGTFFDSIYSSVLIYAYIENGIPLDYTSNIQQQPSQLIGIITNIIVQKI